jgi:hypothetical protein
MALRRQNDEDSSKTVRKHYPPDVTACIFWLKNRQPEKWRDVHRHEVKDITPLKSSDELRAAFLKEVKQLMDEGLLELPPAEQKMIEINPKRNGHDEELRIVERG